MSRVDCYEIPVISKVASIVLMGSKVHSKSSNLSMNYV